MSIVEVAKKKGRPKKTVAETISIVAEPVVVKAKKPRVSRKSTPTSPNDQLEQKDFMSAGAQAFKKNEPLPSSTKAVKELKSRSVKLVAAETAVLASRQVKAPLTRPEPSLILKQATAFVEPEKEESSSKPSEPAKVDPQARQKEFKPAGTLPAVSGLEASKPATPSASSQPKTSLFLADFFTERTLAEQPAWSRSKKPATVSASSSTSPELRAEADTSTRPPRPDTSVPLSASSLPLNPEPLLQRSSETQIPQEPVSTTNLQSAASPRPSAQPERPPVQPVLPAKSSAKFTSQPAMSTKSPTEGPKSTLTPPTNPTSQPPRRVAPLPKMPSRVASASGPKPLKPTEMPYEVLRHDPKFKALSRRWTSLIVAIPILVATSYALYGRYTETTVQRKWVRDQGTSTINGGV